MYLSGEIFSKDTIVIATFLIIVLMITVKEYFIGKTFSDCTSLKRLRTTALDIYGVTDRNNPCLCVRARAKSLIKFCY